MIIKEFKLNNAKILVDDSFLPKTEEEKQQRYELFNSIGCEIISSSIA